MLPAILALSVLLQSPDRAPNATQLSKKDAFVAAKRTAAPPRRADRRARAPVWAHNLRTHEIMPLSDLDPAVRDEAYDRFLRCWFTHEHADLPVALVDAVVAAARHFETREVRVISGFRHPKYNLSLRKKGREVAQSSQHTEAAAIDFFLPGVGTRTLYDHLLATHPGGVGFYPVSEFVHVDLGRKRTWKGS